MIIVIQAGRRKMKKGSHTQYSIEYHIVWTTKYRYKVIEGKIAERLREILRQSCNKRGITIIRGSIGKEHVHMLVSCPPSISVSEMLKYLKGRSSKKLQEEYKSLRKRYWGQHLWSTGYFCRSVGNVTKEIIKEYIENQTEEEKDIFKIIG